MGASGENDRPQFSRAIDEDRTRRRQQWIDTFVERQRITRQWIALAEIAGWCALSVTRASAADQENARTLAYDHLDGSARNGEFEQAGKSKILYLDIAPDGTSPRCRLTREQLGYVDTIRSLAANCYIPRELARQWFAKHSYPWPAHFDPLPQQQLGPASAIAEHVTATLEPKAAGDPRQRPGAKKSPKLHKVIEGVINEHGHPGKTVHWDRFCDLVRTQCGVTHTTRGYGDKTIQRAVKEVVARQDKSDIVDMSDISC